MLRTSVMEDTAVVGSPTTSHIHNLCRIVNLLYDAAVKHIGARVQDAPVVQKIDDRKVQPTLKDNATASLATNSCIS